MLLRPESVGYIKLNSADPFDMPIIDPKYLSHPKDAAVLVDSLKISIKMALSKPFKKFKPKPWPQHWWGCEKYKKYSDGYLECLTRSYTQTIYHPVGTAKMGPPSDPMAVVDPQLRVYGVYGLRVIDASIMPKILSGNTNAGIIMIGEKGADLVKGILRPPVYVKPGHVPTPKTLLHPNPDSLTLPSKIGYYLNKIKG